MRPGWRRWAVLLIFWLAPAGAAPAAEYYYTLIFGSQSHPKRWRHTHTWATFVRAVGEGPDLSRYQLTVHTISWLPQTLEINVWDLHPEPGVNLDLDSTLRQVLSNGETVTMWGPFVVGPHVYNRSLWVKQILESGLAQYRAISTSCNLLVADCIHAVAACDPVFGRDYYPLIRIGKPASRFMAREMMNRSLRLRGINQKAYDNSWLVARLGLDRYPVEVIPPQRIPFKDCFFCQCPP